jgi:AraC family transcriptional regulator
VSQVRVLPPLSRLIIQRYLFRGRLFSIGEFHCPAGHPRWHAVNQIGGAATIAFPATSVVIQHLGAEPLLANANHVVFYNAWQPYRRRLHDGRGDHCLFFELAPEMLRTAFGLEGAPFTHAPSDGQTFLAAHGAARASDELQAEELGLLAVQRAAERMVAFHSGPRRVARERTDREHHRLVEAAKDVLTERLADRLTLGEVARTVHSSEFHLARVFRERTGFTLHGYRTQLRLRVALDQVAAGSADLTALAAELGFSSHAHFTRAFKEVFGSPPSAVRSAFHLRELRRIVEAPLLTRS